MRPGGRIPRPQGFVKNCDRAGSVHYDIRMTRLRKIIAVLLLACGLFAAAPSAVHAEETNTGYKVCLPWQQVVVRANVWRRGYLSVTSGGTGVVQWYNDINWGVASQRVYLYSGKSFGSWRAFSFDQVDEVVVYCY